jgi:predicted nucleic acid-binding protein
MAIQSRQSLAWKESIYEPGTAKNLLCELRDLGHSWKYFRRADLYSLSAVDATSFAIMKRARIVLPTHANPNRR